MVINTRLFIAFIGLLGFALPVSAAPPEYIPGVVLVGFHPGTPGIARANARAAAGARSASPLSNLEPNAEKLVLQPGRSVEQAIKALTNNPNVRYAEPDYKLTRLATSNDPYYTNGSLWGMYGNLSSPANQFGSQAAEAWARDQVGSRSVYVGIIDEGIQVTHPDLQANIWVNPFDAAGDGVDNDGNGRIDDVYGWDFYENNNSVFDGADDHGTHVAGTIGAVGGNGLGVAGVNWQVTMISGKFLGPSGGSTSGAVSALDYFSDLKTRHGLNIVATNNSWGGGGYSTALYDAINRSGDRGILFVAAAGNSTSNNDTTTSYPSNYQCTKNGRPWDCVVAVASITSTGGISSFSSYGATTVDLGAPGSSINSTVSTNSYASYSGTSMATPHVTGAVALCASIDPSLTAAQIRSLLMQTTVPTSSLSGRTVTGGRLDAGALADMCTPPPSLPLSGGPSNLAATATSATSVRLTWTDGTTNEARFEVERSPAGCASFTSVGSAGANATDYDVTGLSAATEYCFRVRAANNYPSQSSWTNTASATTNEVPRPYQCSAVPYSWQSTSGGTSLALGDESFAVVSLPFAFRFYGDSHNQVTVSSNGLVRMGNGSAGGYANAAIPNTAEPNAFAAPLWDDLDPSWSGAVRTATLGTAPNRRFVVSWENVPHYSATGNPFTFQAVLEEATGDVVFNYLDVLAGTSSYDRGRSATVGVENADGSAGTQLSYLSSAVIDNSTSFRCSNAPPPPAPDVAPGSLAATAVSSSQINLTWADTTSTETGFKIERATGTGSFSQIATVGAGVTSFSNTGLSAATTYRYRVRAYNLGGNSPYSAEASATTAGAPPTAPSNVGVSLSTDGKTATVSWRDRSSNETSFEVGRSRRNADGTYSVPTSPIATLPANTTRYVDVPGPGTYRWYVRSVNANGASAWARSNAFTTR